LSKSQQKPGKRNFREKLFLKDDAKGRAGNCSDKKAGAAKMAEICGVKRELRKMQLKQQEQ